LQHWVTANLLRGCEPDVLAVELCHSGLARPEAEGLINDTVTSPIFAAVDERLVRLRKLEQLLQIRRALGRLVAPAEVERHAGLSRDAFLAGYYAANQPVLLTDATEGWSARRWTVAHLAEVLGDAPVEVMAGRQTNPDRVRSPEGQAASVPFAEFAARLAATVWSDDLYMVANNHLLDHPAAAPLFADFQPDERYLHGTLPPGTAHLWCGPAGTVTPLHHDVVNILFVQLLGRKVVKLLPPLDLPLVDPIVLQGDPTVFSALIDLDAVDPARHPDVAELRPLTVVVEPGEALFIPVGWWHQVKALETSISLSFTGFVFPNAYPQL